MKRLLPVVLLVYLLPSTGQAAPITVMRFSGAMTEVGTIFTEHFLADITVGTWFVGAIVLDDDLLNNPYRRVTLDLTLGNYHITSTTAFPQWLGQDAEYDWYHYAHWPGLTGGYIDSLFITAANNGPRKLMIQTVGVGRNYNGGGCCWYQPFITGTIYNVPEPSTMLMLAAGSVLFMRKRRGA